MIRKVIFAFCALALFGCSSSSSHHKLKVGASSTPHAEILAFVKDDLKKQGIDLDIIEIDDYNIPNRSLAEKDLDANYFQHQQFLDEQIAQFHYCLVPMAKIHVEPMGLYSPVLTSLDSFPNGGTVAVPNDPTNEARALQLLAKYGLITLDPGTENTATIHSIKDNPKHLRFIEVDAAILPRSLKDVTLAAIPTNYALQAHLSPEKDALGKEDSSSRYANLLVVRCGDETRADLLQLKAALTSEKTREFILKRFNGAVLPAF